jgi:hypothetical protein
VNGHDVHENIADHADVGWSDALFDGAVTDIDHESRDKIINFNETLVAGSDGMLAPVVREDAKYITMAGSHTTQGHRQHIYILVFLHE